MDKVTLGLRVAQAREAANLTQDSLGRAVDLDRSAVSRLEKGDRKLNVTELVGIARVLKRPLAYFVADPVPAVVSRRTDVGVGHDSSRLLDTELDQFASDLDGLLAAGILRAIPRPTLGQVPKTHEAAENLARSARKRASLDAGPIADLGAACELLGLYSLVAPLGEHGADGACVEVGAAEAAVGAAVINGNAQPGRRRMTLAHELGHWLFGDAYDAGASGETERMISSFAVHFLAPRASVVAVWKQHSAWSTRDRALAVAVKFRLSWSAAVGQLRNLQLIDYDEHALLSAAKPRSGEYLRLALSWVDELEPPYLSPGLTAAILNAFVDERLNQARTLELLRETVGVEDLPELAASSMLDLRRSFEGHDG